MVNNVGYARYLGRFAVIDGKCTRVADTARHVTDTALRTHIASFHGPFVAEREGHDLRVHMLHDELGRPVQENVFANQEGSSGIRSSASSGRDTAGSIGGIGSLTELNAMNANHYAGIGVRRRA
jgi:hypothetical protein